MLVLICPVSLVTSFTLWEMPTSTSTTSNLLKYRWVSQSPFTGLHLRRPMSNSRTLICPHLQLQREIRPFPKLKILRNVESIDDFRAEDFEICDYNPHPAIKMQMAV